MAKVEELVWKCVEPKINELGYEIYDIEYLKEGMNWYLRIYIDKENGISIEDCEIVSRGIDDLIDEMCVIVCQKEKGEVLVRKNDMILALVTKGIIMNNIYTLSDYNAFDGTKLMLI